MKTAQIGRCGELLVQYLLLLRGIESAPMTTDSGIDLVVYSPTTAMPATIQVKTNLRAKPGGGKGKLALDWWLPEHGTAQLIALVDLSSQRVWLFLSHEIAALAQQRSSGRLHMIMATDATLAPRSDGRLIHDHQFDRFLLSERADQIFGTGIAQPHQATPNHALQRTAPRVTVAAISSPGALTPSHLSS